jgi:dTDP-glucose 4,6-dehydratase
MKHILIGGDGFVGRRLARLLADRGDEVLVADIHRSDDPLYERVPFVELDITEPTAFAALALGADDVVYNLAAVMLSPIPPRRKRYAAYMPVNYTGVRYLLDHMLAQGCRKLVHFSTDMVYGPTVTVPQAEDHPIGPFGWYGMSKLASELLCVEYRAKGLDITIFRPRLIIGPGRLGILVKLFRLVDLNLPVPMIGTGRTPYQFISVFDCAEAASVAADKGCPNRVYNLGSLDPPPVRELLGRLVAEANSSSVLMPTPAPLVKWTLGLFDAVNLPVMDPEQYMIADEHCELDVARGHAELGWLPRHRDDDMLLEAYRTYRAAKQAGRRRGGGLSPESAG